MVYAGFLFIVLGIVGITTILISTEADYIEVLLTVFSIFLILIGSLSMIRSPSLTIEKQCEEVSISYTFVQTVAEMTDTPEEDVFTISKYAAANEYELYDVIKMIDSSLSDEEVNAIIITSDLKQR